MNRCRPANVKSQGYSRAAFTNPQIAEALIISRGTVEHHVANILRKLDYRSRSQVAVWAAAHDLLIQPDTTG
jgi:DNA-binding NarL/FixJ family response regulator